MKLKKLLALALVLVMTASVLAGCGASSVHKDMAFVAPEAAAPMEAPVKGTNNVAFSAGGATTPAQTGQKLIRRVNIDAETEDLDALLESLTVQISSLGGYIEQQNLYNGSAYASYRSRNANLTIRIPADQLDGFVGQVKDASNVISYSESQEDVTLTYVSTESRIKALETEEARLLELLAQAENMTDLLQIEARLTDVRYELESVKSQLLVLANQVDYATVYLYISQVKEYTEVEEKTVWQRIGSGFKQNLKELGQWLVDLFVWVVTYSPQLVLLAAILLLLRQILRRRKNRRKDKKEQKRKEEKPEEPKEKGEE